MNGKPTNKQSKKPVEVELTLKDLASVVGGSVVRVLTPYERHKLLHHHGLVRRDA